MILLLSSIIIASSRIFICIIVEHMPLIKISYEPKIYAACLYVLEQNHNIEVLPNSDH